MAVQITEVCLTLWFENFSEARCPAVTVIFTYKLNPLQGTLKPQSNGPLYSNTVIGTLSVDGWALPLVHRGGAWAGCGPTQSPSRCTKCTSPPTSYYLTRHYNFLSKGLNCSSTTNFYVSEYAVQTFNAIKLSHHVINYIYQNNAETESVLAKPPNALVSTRKFY